MKRLTYLTLGFLLLASFGCATGEKGKELEKLPYFNLRGFIELEIGKLEGATVVKTSRVNGEEKIVEVVYTAQEWKNELDAFIQADINTPSLAQSYSTDAQFDYLIHELLPEAKGKVKEIRVRYVKNYPASITFHSKDENLFFSSSTMGDFHLNLATNRLDHYSIETTQKVWFLKPTNIKVSGIIK